MRRLKVGVLVGSAVIAFAYVSGFPYKFSLFCFCVGLSPVAHRPTRFPHVSAEQKAEAKLRTGLTFPASTKFLLYHYSMGLDDSIHLKIEMNAADVPGFLDQHVFREAKLQSKWREVFDHPTWPDFAPSGVQRFRSAQIDLPSAEFMNIVLDEDDAERTVVYIQWCET